MITKLNYETWFLDFFDGKLSPSQKKDVIDFVNNNPDLHPQFECFENIHLSETDKVSFEKNSFKKQKSWLFNYYSIDELAFNFIEGNLSNEELRELNELKSFNAELNNKINEYGKIKLLPCKNAIAIENILLKKNDSFELIHENNFEAYCILYYENQSPELFSALSNCMSNNDTLKKQFKEFGKLKLIPQKEDVFENKPQLKKKETVVVAFNYRNAVAIAAVLLLAILLYNPFKSNVQKIAIKETNLNKNTLANNILSEKKKMAKKENSAFEKDKKENLNSKNVFSNGNFEKKKAANKTMNNSVLSIPNNLKADDVVLTEKDSITNKNNSENEVKNDVSATANNKTNEKGILSPGEFVATVVNKDYYPNQTPTSQINSTFYAMKNVIQSVSGGSADVDKKEDKNYKEFRFRIGGFSLSRKKAKEQID